MPSCNRNHVAHKSGGNSASKSGGNAVRKSGNKAAPVLNEPMATHSGRARKSKDKAAPNLDKPMAPRSSGACKSGGKVASILKPEPTKWRSTTNFKSLATGRPTTSLNMLKHKTSNEIQATWKRSKKGKPVQDDKTVDEYKDIVQILDPLLNGIASVQRLFAIYADNASWYKTLGKCKETLEDLCQTISNRVDLINHKDLKDSFTYHRKDKSNDKDHAIGRVLVEQFWNHEKLRVECITESKKFPPSIYCQTPIWQQCQKFSNFAIWAGCNDGLPITFPLPLALLHPAFQIFIYSMWYPPRLKFTSEATVTSMQNLIHVAQCVDNLLLSMPRIYWSHDQRLHAFKEALVIAFPENEVFEWSTNCTMSLDPSNPANARERVDLIYRNRKTLVPSIFVEVKLKPGDPFWQNGHIYQL